MKKLVSQIKKRAARPILRLALVTDNPALAAWVLSWVMWRAEPKEFSDKQGPRVLCMGRSIFVDDVKALARYGGHFDYIVIHRHFFDQIFTYFFTPEVRKTITDNSYYVDERGQEGKKRYSEFIRRMLPLLQKRLRFVAFLSGHFTYVEQQAIMSNAAALGVPFIVLHKEGMGIYNDIAKTNAGTRFVGSKMLFYNENIREAFIKLNLPGLTADRTAVVGIPRLDCYFQHSPPPKYKQITLFAIYTKGYADFVKDQNTFAEIEKRIREFYRLAMEFAVRHPEIRVIIKTKVAPHFVDEVQQVKDEYFKGQSIPNLTITYSSIAADLIRDSIAVLSYNSTTLVEALLAGKLVVTPDFTDLGEEFAHFRVFDRFANYPELTHRVRKLADLEQLVINPEKYGNENEQRRTEFLHSLMYIADGGGSRRVENEIISELNKS